MTDRVENILRHADARQLQYPWLAKKVCPGGYIHVDQALHKLGSRLFPEHWCATAVWDEMPITYSTKRKQYRKTIITKMRPGEATTRRLQALKGSFPHEEIRAASKCYIKVMRELYRLIDEETVKFLLIDSRTFNIISGARLDKNPFYAGFRSVLTTGLFFDKSDKENRSIYRVVIREKELNIYLEGRNRIDQNGDVTIPRAFESEIIDVILDHAQKNNYSPTADRTYASLSNALKGFYSIPRSDFDAHIWGAISKKQKKGEAAGGASKKVGRFTSRIGTCANRKSSRLAWFGAEK